MRAADHAEAASRLLRIRATPLGDRYPRSDHLELARVHALTALALAAVERADRETDHLTERALGGTE